MEHDGADSMISNISFDTALPQSTSDTNWDACEFAVEGPPVSLAFTDMTNALVQYETCPTTKAVLEFNLLPGEGEAYLQHQHSLITKAKIKLEENYLGKLDSRKLPQKIVLELNALAFERLYLAIHQPLFKHANGGELATPELRAE